MSKEVKQIDNFDILLPKGPKSIIEDSEKLKIDYDMLTRMMGLDMSKHDMCLVLGCTAKVLEERVKEDFKDKGYVYVDLDRFYRGSYIRNVVRVEQIKKALSGDSRMLQWLGVNYLGQGPEGVRTSDGESSGTPIQELIRIAKEGDVKYEAAIERATGDGDGKAKG